jgi:5,10-methylenetetrahydromethanopterin reductase
MTIELWAPMGFVEPSGIGDRARQLEADGWDGMKVFDTQCLFAETTVMMTAAALATERLQLSISTSNPVTRHPAVAAASIATLAAVAGDRVFFGVGRGDSALAYIGGAPAPVALFERYVAAVRRYLHGESVSFESISEWRLTKDVSTIDLGETPEHSRLNWLAADAVAPPIEIFATGPRVLGVAGRWADRVSLGLGADARRLEWAIATAQAARADAGLDPATLSAAAVISIGVSDDLDRARGAVANMVASAARFAVISGPVVGPTSEAQREVYHGIRRSYDMNQHGGHGAQVQCLTDDFIDTFAIVGTPERCIERILELHYLGIDSFMLAPPLGDADAGDIEDGYRRVTEEVLPGVREATRDCTTAASPERAGIRAQG